MSTVSFIVTFMLCLVIGAFAGWKACLIVQGRMADEGKVVYKHNGKWHGSLAAFESVCKYAQVSLGMIVIRDMATGQWYGSEDAWNSLTQQLLHPCENQAEWLEEDDRPDDDDEAEQVSR